jgi:microcystin degradation protein MlrC
MKVIIGAFAHESNDFCPSLTKKEMFEFYEGEDIFSQLPVDDIFLEAGIDVIPSIFASAQSFGTVEENAFLYFEEKILAITRKNPDVDGIWMFCHGAMNVENIGSGEYKLACDVRNLVGQDCVISFGMDLHGNIEKDLANKVNIIRCYHTAPHTDQVDTYRRTAKALVHYLIKGYHHFSQLRKISMIFPGEMAATTVEPFKGIVSYMKDLEENDPKVLCASTFIGFAWMDAERTSSSVVVVPSSPDYEGYCSKKADELAGLVFSKRCEFGFEELSLSPALTVEYSLNNLEPTVCVTDMGDNPTAGTLGGSTVLLREFIKNPHPGKKVLIAGIYDKNAFGLCQNYEPNKLFDLSIGIDVDEVTRPIKLKVTYKGRYDVHGYNIIGSPINKRCEAVLLSFGTIDIIVTDKAYAFTQKVNFSSCGIDTSLYDVFVTKFGYIYPELREMAASFIMSNTPGESCQMIEVFDYKQLVRPIYPLDKI